MDESMFWDSGFYASEPEESWGGFDPGNPGGDSYDGETFRPDFSVSTGGRGAERYPLMDQFLNWTIETYDHIPGKRGVERLNYLRRRNPAPTLRISRATGVTDIFIRNTEGGRVGINPFLNRLGLSIDQLSAKTEKRLSRLFRPSYAFGAFSQDQIQVKEFQGDEKVWDALGVISQDALHALTAHLSPQVQAEYLKQGRFETTLMGQQGQWKGHLVVDQTLKGSQVQVTSTSWKKEIHMNLQDAHFIDIRPKHMRAGDLWLDSQTYTNLYRYLVPNETFYQHMEEASGRFLDNLRSGYSAQDALKLFFSGVDSEAQFQSRLGMLPYEYLVSGGRIEDSPDMTRLFGTMWEKKVRRHAGRYSIPFPNMFSLYLTSAVGMEPGQDWPGRGEVYLDDYRSAVFFNPLDYPAAADRHGGGDQDDLMKLVWTWMNGQAYALMTRSPNVQGEYSLFKVANPEFFEKHHIPPTDLDQAGFSRITPLEKKVFDYPDKLPPGPKIDYQAHDQLANDLMYSTQKNIAVTGQYINVMTALTHIYGSEPWKQVAGTEAIIDQAQKEMGPLEVVKNWYTQRAIEASLMPMARDDWRRIYNLLPPELQDKGYIPAVGHQIDELGSFFEQHLEQVRATVNQIANRAAPPAELYPLTRIYDPKDPWKLKERLWVTYKDALKAQPKDAQGRIDSEGYRAAHQVAYDYLMGLNQEDRDQTLLQVLTNPTSGGKGSPVYMNDKIAWLTDRDTDGNLWGIGYLTMDLMRRAGTLGQKPSFAQYKDTTEPARIGPHLPAMGDGIRTTRAYNLVVRPDWNQYNPKDEDGQAAPKPERDAAKAAWTRSLLGSTTEVALAGGTYSVSAGGRAIGSMSPEYGDFTLQEGRTIRAFHRNNDLILSVADPSLVRTERGAFTFRYPQASERDKLIINRLQENAGLYAAGQLSTEGLHPSTLYALRAATAQAQGQPVTGADRIEREWFDPNQKISYGRRIRSRAPFRWAGVSDVSKPSTALFSHGPQGAGIAVNHLELEQFGEFDEYAYWAGGSGESSAELRQGLAYMSTYHQPSRAFALEHEFGHYLNYVLTGAPRGGLKALHGFDRWFDYPADERLEYNLVAPQANQLALLAGSSIEDLFATEEFASQFALHSLYPSTAQRAYPDVHEYFGRLEDTIHALREAAPPIYHYESEGISVTPGGSVLKANRIAAQYGRRMRGEAPRGYFPMEFTPKYLDDQLRKVAEGGQALYSPRFAGEGPTAGELGQLGDQARQMGEWLFGARPVPSELKRQGTLGGNDWRAEFVGYHFGGGNPNIPAFQRWIDQLPDPGQGGPRWQFEKAYATMYSEYLYYKHGGERSVNYAARGTAWGQYWNAWRGAWGLGEFPDTFMLNYTGRRWGDPIPAPEPGNAPNAGAPQPAAGGGAGGAGAPPPVGGMPPMPEEGPDPRDEDAPAEDDAPEPPQPGWRAPFPHREANDPHFRYQQEQRERVAANARAGRNTAAFLPPGKGKTQLAIALAAEMGGVSLLVSPQAELNRQQPASLMADNDLGALWLPGHPGYGKDETDYIERVQRIRDALDERMSYRNGRRVWNENAPPLVITLSPEKLAHLTDSSIGQELLPHIRSVTIDEAQEFANYTGREMMTNTWQTLDELDRGLGRRVPRLVMGGTVDQYAGDALIDAYRIDDAFGEPVEAPWLRAELRPVRTANQILQGGLQFAQEAESAGLKSLIYAYSTKAVDQVYDLINGAGMEAVRFHRGQGLHGMMSDEELAPAQAQLNNRRLLTHLIGSSALGLGLNIKNLARVAQLGPAGVSDLVQRILRIRRNEFSLQNESVFRFITNPDWLDDWGNNFKQDMNTMAMRPEVIADSFLVARRGTYSANWKEASDQISDALGAAGKAHPFKVDENRGAEMHSILRQAGLITMEMAPTEIVMPDGGLYNTVVQRPVFNTSERDITGRLLSTRYSDPYDPLDELSLDEYAHRIGERRYNEYTAVANWFREASAYRDPQVQSDRFLSMVFKGYQRRYTSQAPKVGHENIGIKVRKGDGEEQLVYESAFTGPESSEISITTYGRAFTRAITSGGSIVGSWHSQPTGRTDEASETDMEGLAQLGRMEISEGEVYQSRLTARAGEAPDPNRPQRRAERGQPAYASGNQQVAHGIHLDDAEGVTRGVRDLLQAFKDLTDQAQALTDVEEKRTRMVEAQTRFRQSYDELIGNFQINKPQHYQYLSDELGNAALRERDPWMIAQFSSLRDQAGAIAWRGMQGGGGGNRANSPDGGGDGGGADQGDWGDRPGVIKMSSVLQAMRAWSYIAEPVIGKAYTGTNDYLPIGAALGDKVSYGTTSSGFRTRYAMGQEYMGQGAYEAFAGFLDLPYAMSGGSPAFARGLAQAQVGVGLAMSGSEIGSGMLSNSYFMPRGANGQQTRDAMLMARLGQTVWTGSMIAGAVMAVGGVANEWANESNFFNEFYGGKVIDFDIFGLGRGERDIQSYDEGWGSAIMRGLASANADRSVVTQKILDNAGNMGLAGAPAKLLAEGWGRITGSLVGATGFVPGLGPVARAGIRDMWKIDRNDYIAAGYTPEKADYFMFGEGTENERRYSAFAQEMAKTFGGDKQQYVGVVASAAAQLGAGGIGLMQNAAPLGMDPGAYLNSVVNMGQQYGYLPGSMQMAQFAQNFGAPSLEQLARRQEQASQFAQVAGQMAPYLGYQRAANVAMTYGIRSPAAAQSAASMVDLAQQYGFNDDWVLSSTLVGFEEVRGGNGDKKRVPKFEDFTAGEALAGALSNYTPQQQRGMIGVTSAFLNSGFDISDPNAMIGLTKAIGTYFSGYNYQQMQLTGQILSGDMGAQSYASWNAPNLLANVGMSVEGARWFGQNGNPIFQSSFTDFMKLSNAQARQGNPYGVRTDWAPGYETAAMRQFLGAASGQNFSSVSEDMLSVLATGGTQDLEWYMFGKQRDWTNRSFNLQMDQFNASKAYTQQMWGYEDQQRALQHRSQMADFAYQRQRMDLGQKYAEQSESLSWTRMTAGHEYQLWQLGFNYETSLMQRQWQREDYQYQDQIRGLQFGWNMEDLNEAIRFSTGRQRRQLVRQRDRAAQTHNLEEEQIDTQRERQEQLNAREDERYKKLVEYTEKMMDLDKESFDLNKKQREEFYQMDRENLQRHIQEYQKSYDLETQIQEAQREYQKLQWDFQQRSFDIQKEQIQAQHDYELIMKTTAQHYEDIAGYYKQMAEYDPGKLLKGLIGLLAEIDGLDVVTLSSLSHLMDTIDALDPTKIQALEAALS